jgi:hypothetical protein
MVQNKTDPFSNIICLKGAATFSRLSLNVIFLRQLSDHMMLFSIKNEPHMYLHHGTDKADFCANIICLKVIAAFSKPILMSMLLLRSQ